MQQEAHARELGRRNAREGREVEARGFGGARALVARPLEARDARKVREPGRVLVSAKESREMRAVLEHVKGRIVDGPSAVGAYTVEVPVPATASERVAPVLEVLRTQPKVRLAEPIRGR